MSSNTLIMYRKMLKSATRMIGKQKTDAIKMIREEFRRNNTERDPERVRTLLEKANSSLSYMKIVSPKAFEDRNQTGETVIKFGTERKQSKAAATNWTGKNMDPDSVSKHNNLLKRAGFANNAHAKGIF